MDLTSDEKGVCNLCQFIKVLAFCLMFLLFQGCVTPGIGKVIDSKTSEPISNALVTMECEKTKGYHSYEIIKTESYITTEEGVYRFGFLDVFGCNIVYVHAQKEGYVELIGDYPVPRVFTDFRSIPNKIYLTNISEAEKIYIEKMCKESRIFDPNKKYTSQESYKYAYYTRYVAFLVSKGYSRSLDDDKYISDCFCPDLISCYNELNDDDKLWLKKQFINPLINYHHMPQRIDHDKVVIPHCNAGADISK